ncbi:MAG: hypothetical protein LBV49_04975 [Azonexus sp.]|jgi:hypothetical protein|nr:hypothetical protein [Azonexus sp.]
MRCAKCGREAPPEAIYCPHCAGERRTTDREVIRGGLKGGFLGLLLGLLPAALLLAIYGPVRGVKALAFVIPAATFTTGLIIGLVKAKRDWK